MFIRGRMVNSFGYVFEVRQITYLFSYIKKLVKKLLTIYQDAIYSADSQIIADRYLFILRPVPELPNQNHSLDCIVVKFYN